MIRSIILSSCLGLCLVATVNAQETPLEDRLNRIEGLLDSGSLLRMDRVQQQLREEFAALRNDVDLLTRDLNDLKRQQRSLYEDTDQRLRLLEQWLPETPGAAPAARPGGSLSVPQTTGPAALIVPGGDRLAPPAPVAPEPAGTPATVTVPPAPAQQQQTVAVTTPTVPEPVEPAGPAETAAAPGRPPAPIIVAPDALAGRATQTDPTTPPAPVDPALPPETTAAVTTGTTDSPAPLEEDPGRQVASEYNQAFELLQAGEFESAGFGFRRIISDFPDTPFASSARYWLAESHYVMREFDQAEAYFQQVIDDPATSRRAEALLKLGFIHYEREDWPAARRRLEQVVADYSDSTNAVLAQDRLNEMRAAGR